MCGCVGQVRESNAAAFHLYNVTLGYQQHDVEVKYYADGEEYVFPLLSQIRIHIHPTDVCESTGSSKLGTQKSAARHIHVQADTTPRSTRHAPSEGM